MLAIKGLKTVDLGRKAGRLRKLAARFLRRRTIKQVQLLSPWFHDIEFPGLGIHTFWLCGIDERLLISYEPQGFPRAFLARIPVAELRNKRVLEIGPASGFYTIELAQQDNDVVCIESGRRFVDQVKFVRRYFHLEDRTKIYPGTFPEVVPQGPFDVVWCLGVLYHIRDFTPFVSGIKSVGASSIYLETLISKTGQTIIAGKSDEGYAFSEQDLTSRVLSLLPDYLISERIDYTDSRNAYYNELPYYRSLLHLVLPQFETDG